MSLPTRGEAPLAFISHNKADTQAAHEIAMFLVAENVGVWFDEWEIAVGDSIVEKIEEDLQSCSHFFILWSERASRSEWVRRELRSQVAEALKTGRPKIIPVCLDTIPLPALLRDIRKHNYQGGSEEDRWACVRAVTGHDPSESYTKAVVKKYKELVVDESTPIPFRACPECGSTHLKGSGGSWQDKNWVSLRCTECGWKAAEEV